MNETKQELKNRIEELKQSLEYFYKIHDSFSFDDVLIELAYCEEKLSEMN